MSGQEKDAKRSRLNESAEEMSVIETLKQLHEESLKKNEQMFRALLAESQESLLKEVRDSLSDVRLAVDGIKARVEANEADIDELKKSMSFTADAVKDSDASRTRAVKAVESLDRELNSVKGKLAKAQSAIIDSESKARRNHLLFQGAKEAADGEGEDCMKVVRDFCENIDGLKAKTVRRSLQLAHRVGAKKTESTARPRPIKAVFSDFSVREAIRSGRGKLPAGVTVREDLPIEVRKARESLYGEADRLRENKNNRVAFTYPARLMLNGKVHKIAHPIDF